MITKLARIFNHILHMSSLSHFNSIWKVPLMWFQKKQLDAVFFIQTNVSVWIHYFFWKNTIIWKITRIVWEDLCQKIIFNVSQNTKWNEKNLPPK